MSELAAIVSSTTQIGSYKVPSRAEAIAEALRDLCLGSMARDVEQLAKFAEFYGAALQKIADGRPSAARDLARRVISTIDRPTSA